MKPKHNHAVVVLPMTIEVHQSCSLLVAAKDGEDRNGLKLEKTDQFFQVWRQCQSERHQKLNTNSWLCHKYISYHVSGLSGMLYV